MPPLLALVTSFETWELGLPLFYGTSLSLQVLCFSGGKDGVSPPLRLLADLAVPKSTFRHLSGNIWIVQEAGFEEATSGLHLYREKWLLIADFPVMAAHVIVIWILHEQWVESASNNVVIIFNWIHTWLKMGINFILAKELMSLTPFRIGGEYALIIMAFLKNANF